MKNARRDAVIYSEINGGVTDAARIIRGGRRFSFVSEMGAYNRKRCKVQATPVKIPGCAIMTDRPAQVI